MDYRHIRLDGIGREVTSIAEVVYKYINTNTYIHYDTTFDDLRDIELVCTTLPTEW